MNNTSDVQCVLDSLADVDYKAYYIGQGLGLIYTILCLLWLPYVIANIYSQIGNKRRIVTLMHLKSSSDYTNRLFMLKETLFRYVIFLVFLCFELIYCLHINIFGVMIFDPKPVRNIFHQIVPHCSIELHTFIRVSFDRGSIGICMNIIILFGDFSFSMMIWLFGASLLHLRFAARNKLRVKVVIHFILLGIVIYLIVVVLTYIPYTRVFGILLLGLMDQISFFIVLYIAKKRFFPAMNSRVIDAFHLHNTYVYLQQKRLLKQYKVIVFVFLFTSELYILKRFFLFDLFVILESISQNLCWFNVTYNLPMVIIISESTKTTLILIYTFCSVLLHFIDLVVYINFIIVNLNIMYVTAKGYLKHWFYDRERYRYQISSNPLLS
ncbi:hypothetical protein LOD99_11768 [Oopsacas minuta]|uniref:Odorant receptor n=1 Tax=Oopsacas minuta TaxID=111878 RepID=A0AAV7JL42_9METZ|nr:hypothetical protein LOD99_11768 [Oopsacas minuta]